MTCTHGCTKFAQILYDEEFEGDYYELVNIKYDELKNFKCADPIIDDEYGHINYALMAYATSHGHLDCLKELHVTYEAGWHTDLAGVAIENDQFECLQYIMEKMGGVQCGKDIINSKTPKKYRQYIQKTCKNCKANKEHVV